MSDRRVPGSSLKAPSAGEAPPAARTDLAVRLLVAGLLVGSAAACGRGQAEEAPTVQAAVVARQDLRLTAEATGNVEPIRTVEVKSKASGEVLRLHVDTGDRLEPGALMVQIDPRDVRNAFNQAEADLEVAQARVEISEAQLRRSQELRAAGVITEQEFEGSNLEFANAKAQLVKAQTNLDLARLRLDDVTIRAPLAGTVIQKNVEEGQVIQSASSNVSGGTTLLVMANLDEMQVRTLVDETDVGEIRAGLSASVEVEAFPGRVFQGLVEKIEPQAVVQQNVTMFPVIVKLDNREGLLKPGMNAEVEILITERPGTLVVPNNAIVTLQEMAPAAMVLGLDPESVSFDRSVFASLQGRAGAAGGDDAADGPSGPEGAPAPGARPAFDSLRARVERGEISQDSARALMAARRATAGQGATAQGTLGSPAGGRPGGGRGGVGGSRFGSGNGASVGRPALTFVVLPDSTIQPRPILIGVNDWDNTEVVAGLEEGEQVALIGAAQLQAQQQEWIERIRSFRGTSPFGGGGPPRGR